jgi:hypothetical protein
LDFLTERSAPDGVETIITNPPYMHADEFVRNALALVPRVAMLLRVLFYEGVGRSDILEGGRLARVHVFRERLQTHRDGWEGPRNTNAMGLAWYVWERSHDGAPRLNRISPVDDKPYDGRDDFAKSLGVAYSSVRERKAAGGAGWEPHVPEGEDIPPFLRRAKP